MSDERVALELVVLGLEPTRLEPVRATEEIAPLEALLLAGPERPRMCLALGAEAGRSVFFFLDALRPEGMASGELARAIGEGRLHALRPFARPPAAPALAAYARRHRIVPAGVGSHLAGRLIALAAAGRELRRLAGEHPEHAETFGLAHRRLGRLHSEAAAEAQALVDAG
jgi:hypothetical protein